MKISHVIIILLIAHILVMSQKLPCGTTYEFYENTHPSLTGMSLIELDQSIAKRIAGKGLKKVQNTSNDILRIPVVFHIIHRSFIPVGEGENYSDIVILDILKNINDAFRKTPGTYWNGDGVDSKIEFCLASIDPDGNSTSGIVRVNGSVIPGFDSIGVYLNSSVSPKSEDLRKLSWWDNKNYINIYILHNIERAGGFSNGYSVAISMTPFIESMDYDTYIHELGHYLSLYHIFQDSCSETDCATQGDRVCDTPPTKIGNLGSGFCQGAPTCGTGQLSLVRNYMDYGMVACHNMFTLGQVERMRAALDTTIKSDLRSNLATTGNLIKTGCYGNVPPRSLFLADKSMSCIEDTVTFRNFSRNATSYFWKFENARPETSTQKEPRVVFNKAGDQKVSLTSTNVNGSNEVDTVFHVEGISAPVVTGSLMETENQHTLSAQSSYNLNWFESDSSNTIIATGSNYITPVLSKSKTYFVQAYGTGAEKTVGMIDNQHPLAGLNGGNVYFSVYKTLVLKTVKVYAHKDKFKFYLRDKNALILKEITVDGDNIPIGQMTLELNIKLSPGHYYFEYYYNDDPDNYWINSLGIDSDGAAFPYKVDGLISIDSTDMPDNYYIFYYDWKIQEILCKSERVPVTAAVKGDLSSRMDEPPFGNMNVHVSLNSLHNALNVSFNTSRSLPVTIGIFNLLGNRIKKVDLKKSSTGLTIYMMDIAALAPGKYIVEIKTGTEKYRADFLKQ